MPSSETALDGRVARGVRNRQAVVAACLALVEEGDLRPTAQRVAERAGVSLRAVFSHFEDMESLMESAARAHEAEYRPTLAPLPTRGPRSHRIEAFVEQRAATAERVLPVYRAALLAEPSSPVVARRLATSARAARTELARVFAPELARLGTERLEALDAVTSLDAWVRLRVRQRLSAARAALVVRDAVVSLLS